MNMLIAMCYDEPYKHKEQDTLRLHFSAGLKDSEEDAVRCGGGGGGVVVDFGRK